MCLLAIISLSGCTTVEEGETVIEIVEIYEVEYIKDDLYEDIFFLCNSSINNGSIENVFSVELSVGDIIKLTWIEEITRIPANQITGKYTSEWVLKSITLIEVEK